RAGALPGRGRPALPGAGAGRRPDPAGAPRGEHARLRRRDRTARAGGAEVKNESRKPERTNPRKRREEMFNRVIAQGGDTLLKTLFPVFFVGSSFRAFVIGLSLYWSPRSTMLMESTRYSGPPSDREARRSSTTRP